MQAARPAAAAAAPPSAFPPAGADQPPPPLLLLLYTTPSCPLCDGLADKVEAVLAASRWSPGPLARASLRRVDVAAAPVDGVAAVDAPTLRLGVPTGGGGAGMRLVPFPRPTPRVPLPRLAAALASALEAAEGGRRAAEARPWEAVAGAAWTP